MNHSKLLVQFGQLRVPLSSLDVLGPPRLLSYIFFFFHLMPLSHDLHHIHTA